MSKYTALVLEGGGVSGIGHAGALKVLKERGILDNIKIFAGSSAGSIAAAGLAIGMPVEDVEDVLLNTDFSIFKDDSIGYVKDVWRLIHDFGWYKGDELERWFSDLLEKYNGNRDLDFQELYEKTGNILIITVTDINQGAPIYVSYKTHPKGKVAKWVRRSSSIPLFFKADKEKMKTEILTDKGDPIYKEIDHYFIDGGVLDNYPIKEVYKYVPKEEVIGIKLMTTKELYQLKNPHLPENPYPPNNLYNYVLLLVTMLRSNLLRMHIDEEDWQRTIKVDVENISATDFNLSREEKLFLISQGEKASLKFLELNETKTK